MAVVITGVDVLKRRLRAMPPAAATAIRAAIDQSADELLSAQRSLAERNRRTGRTIASLKKRQGAHDLMIEVFSDHFAARFEEFGTVKMAAIPFFFAPYRLLVKKAISRIKRATNKAAKDAIGVR